MRNTFISCFSPNRLLVLKICMLQTSFEECVCEGSLIIKPRRSQQARDEEVSWFPRMAVPAESVQVNRTWLEIPQSQSPCKGGVPRYGGGRPAPATDVSHGHPASPVQNVIWDHRVSRACCYLLFKQLQVLLSEILTVSLVGRAPGWSQDCMTHCNCSTLAKHRAERPKSAL